MRSITDLAGELASVIVGVKPDAPRTRVPGESLIEQAERRRLLDKRTQVENLLVAFGEACSRKGTES